MLTYEDTGHLKIKDEIQLLGYFVDITNCNDWFKIWKREENLYLLTSSGVTISINLTKQHCSLRDNWYLIFTCDYQAYLQ